MNEPKNFTKTEEENYEYWSKVFPGETLPSEVGLVSPRELTEQELEYADTLEDRAAEILAKSGEITIRVASWYSCDGLFWVRIFGRGIHWKDTTKHGLLFSERNGQTKRLQIGKWSFRFLEADREGPERTLKL
jgi:hypothetical protein